MRKSVLAVISIAIIIVLIIPTLWLTVPQEEGQIIPADSPQLPDRGFYMGILPTPAEGQSFASAYEQASENSEFVPTWGKPSPFYKMEEDLGGDWGETFIEGYTRGNGMFPLVQFSFIGPDMSLMAPPGMENPTLSHQEWRDAYKEAILGVLESVKPFYLSIGNEVNRWYEAHGNGSSDPNGFQHFVSLYEEIYQEAKSISPDTRVFCTFAREIVAENREAEMDVLELFNSDCIDLLVLTSYPHSVQGINSPSDIPSDYYYEVFDHIGSMPLGFSEVAWPSMQAFGGERGQYDFLQNITTLCQGLDLEILAWSWLHDLNENDHTGLIEHDGAEKEAYGAWQSLNG